MNHISPGTGYHIVDTRVCCVLTRFEVISFWGLCRFFLMFRSIQRESKAASGLLRSTFLIENLRTCYSFSLWKNEKSILEFNTVVHEHINAANSSFRYLRRIDGKPQLWSAQFTLTAVSPHNLRWDGLDISSLLAFVTT